MEREGAEGRQAPQDDGAPSGDPERGAVLTQSPGGPGKLHLRIGRRSAGLLEASHLQANPRLS